MLKYTILLLYSEYLLTVLLFYDKFNLDKRGISHFSTYLKFGVDV